MRRWGFDPAASQEVACAAIKALAPHVAKEHVARDFLTLLAKKTVPIETRLAAADVLAGSSRVEVQRAVLRGLSSKDDSTAAVCARAARGMENPRIQDALVELRRHPSSQVSQEAVQSLKR